MKKGEKSERSENKGKFVKNFGLKDQMRRAAVSIPGNIAEGKERETVPEVIPYLYIFTLPRVRQEN